MIQTPWDLNPGQTGSVRVIAWFATPAQARASAGTGTPIPSSRMGGRVATGAPVTFTAFTQNTVGGVGSAGGSLQLFNVSITGTNKTVTRSDNLQLQLGLTGAPVLPPGTYSGTLNVQGGHAIAQCGGDPTTRSHARALAVDDQPQAYPLHP